MNNLPETTEVQKISAEHSDNAGFLPREPLPFKTVAYFWDSFRTWHMGFLRHIGFFHKRPEKVNQGEHAAQMLAGFCELLKMAADTCYYRRPLNPTWSPRIGYYVFDLFRVVREGDRLHMTLHDLASEINPSFVTERGSCYICTMMRAFGTIIHSGVASSWGHPMTWHNMASGRREGIFLVGLFRMAIQQADKWRVTPLEIERLKHCYELLMQLLYMAQAEAENRLTGGVSVGIQQFQREVESVLDNTANDIEEFSLLGFGGIRVMQLRNVRDPKVLEELMDKDRIVFQQHAESITNDYSKTVHKGFIGDNTGTVNFSDSETDKQKETPKKEKAGGANPPNKEIQNLIRQILEESDIGFSAADLFLQLQTRNATIPEWVQNKPDMKSYISTFIGSLRKELELENKTISKSPYRIISGDAA